MVETLKTSNLVSDPKQRVGSDESVQFAALSAPGSFNVRVMNRQTVAEGIIYFELGPSYSEALPAWSPDAHIALESQGAPLRLYYHARQKLSCAFIEQLSAAPYADKLHPSFDEDAPTPISSIFTPGDAGSLVYICGPFGFVEAVASAAHACVVESGRIRRELFLVAPSVTSERISAEQAFMDKIKSTGQEVEVPAGTAVVQAFAAVGVNVLVSYERGLCGSCLNPVLDGIPDHPDQFMLPEEQMRNDGFTPCCSRALTACFVLDI